ncbi:MAG: hypothetical protein AABY22_30945, partial [Nanoarchaeota archaeon]
FPDEEFDWLIFWGDSTCPLFNWLHQYKAKKGIFLTTDVYDWDNMKKLDVIFAESQPIVDSIKEKGLNVIKAFGTDTDFYDPAFNYDKKTIGYFYPATFSPWKKQSTIAYLGNKLFCVGTVQPDGYAELSKCKGMGVQIEIGYFPAEKIRQYYRRAKRVIIPAVHGSERTVLESFSMGIVPEVTNLDNIRARSYIEEYKKSGLTARDFVITNYSHVKYAEKILEAFES